MPLRQISPHRPKSLMGFTLIELSIVLVIIGLIVGGIMVGRDLIRAAELRSVVSDVERFTTAAMTFKTKYNALPGDMPNAGDYWGLISTDPDTCKATPTAPGTQTCNGDGNGHVSSYEGYLGDPVFENFRFWQHLANAGLVAGSFTGGGIDNSYLGSGTTIVGVNAPATHFNPKVGYEITYLPPGWTYGAWGTPFYNSGLLPWININYSHSFVVGADTSKTAFLSYGPMLPAFSSEDAQSLDSKIDDGNPVTGGLVALLAPASFAGNPTCVDAGVTLYNIAQSGQCALVFAHKF